MGHDTVPLYTPSSPSPHYSSELLPGEQIIEFNRRALSRPPTGVYRRITDHLTIVLRDQHPGSVCPIYGRGGFIQGEVILGSGTRGLTSVILKVRVDLYIFVVSYDSLARGPLSSSCFWGSCFDYLPFCDLRIVECISYTMLSSDHPVRGQFPTYF